MEEEECGWWGSKVCGKKTEQKNQTPGHRDVKEGKWDPPVMSVGREEERRKEIVLNQELTDKIEARSSCMWKGNMGTAKSEKLWQQRDTKNCGGKGESMNCRATKDVQWFKRPQRGDSHHMEMGWDVIFQTWFFPPRSEPFQKFFLESGDRLLLLIMLLPLIRGSDCFKHSLCPFLSTQPGWCYFTAGLCLRLCNIQMIWYYPSSDCEIPLRNSV